MQNIYLQDVVLLKPCLQNDGKAKPLERQKKQTEEFWLETP